MFTEQGLSVKEPASKAKKTRGIHMIEDLDTLNLDLDITYDRRYTPRSPKGQA